MSADRLRAAADRLDVYARFVADLGSNADDMREAQQAEATAVLLRTVAAEHESFAERVGTAVMEGYDDATHDAALALADTILGSDQ